MHRRDTLFVHVQELAESALLADRARARPGSRLGRAREELCDNYVLQVRDAVSYGETLLHLAELSIKARPLGAAVGILHWRGDLERRIAGFLEEGRSTMTRSNRWLAGIVVLLSLLGGSLASATRFVAGRARQAAESAPMQEAKGGQAEAPAQQQPAPAPQEKRSMLVHVLGPDGQPMAGVKIHRSVWTRKRIPNANVKYVSDENGEARVDLPDGIDIFRLWARAKGYVPLFAHWEEEDVPERSLPAEYTLRLQQGTVIGGIVRNSDGQPIKGVSVDVMLNRGGQVEGRTGPDMWLSEDETPVTDADGRWSLNNIPPSLNLDLRLKLSHPDYVSDRQWGESQDLQGVDLKALRSRKATITMRGGLMVTGTVTDPQGKPVVGAVVVRGDDPYLEVGSQEVRTDEHGRYQFPPLPAGSVTVTVIAQGWMPALRKVEVRSGHGSRQLSPRDWQGVTHPLRRQLREAGPGRQRRHCQVARRQVALQSPSSRRPPHAHSRTGRRERCLSLELGPRRRREVHLRQGGVRSVRGRLDRRCQRADGQVATDPQDLGEGYRRGHGSAGPAVSSPSRLSSSDPDS